MKAWVPYPRYLFRKEIALLLLRRHVPPGAEFLEIGRASGDFASPWPSGAIGEGEGKWQA